MILKIIDGVRAGVGNNSLDARALALNDVTEDFCRKLLTLVMANDANLNLLLVAEILVIVHLTRDEGVSTLAHRLRQQEVASTTTDGHLTNGTLQQFVTHGTLDVELFFDKFYKRPCVHFRGQVPYYTTACFQTVYRLLSEELTTLQSQPFGYLPVHPVQRIIHIGMHRYDDHVVLDGLDDTALHVVGTADLLQATKQQRMVTHDEVTPLRYRLVDNLFVDVQTQ